MHVPNPDKFKEVPVRPKDVITYRVEEGALSNFCPSLQFPKAAALSEFTDQVNKIEIRN